MLPQGKTLAISLASGVNQRTLAAGTAPQPQPQAAPAYTAKDCSCGWASHGVCAAGSDDGSVCWSACCTPLLQGGGAIAAEQSSVFYGTNGRKYTGSIVRTGSTFRNSTSTRRAAPPPPARTPNRAAEVAHD